MNKLLELDCAKKKNIKTCNLNLENLDNQV